jgi:hypothetical protein
MSAATESLSAEYWISFAALMCSHVAMRSVSEPKSDWRLIAKTADSLEVAGRGRRLRLVTPGSNATAKAELTVITGDCLNGTISFSFSEDGQVCFRKPSSSSEMNCMDMDAAAEFLLNGDWEGRSQ